ncbi:MAG: hypothetical protein EOO61_01550 [Hymenobacter sp.]|nr:MAG: hypothetical protein EOO61_01550 [Hymenobacter sp.]
MYIAYSQLLFSSTTVRISRILKYVQDSVYIGYLFISYVSRLNQTSVLIQREGTYYGQCSEICGSY